MKPIANPARSVDVARQAAVLADAGDSLDLGASLHQAGTALDVRRSHCHRDRSRALASSFAHFPGDYRGAGVAAIAPRQRVVPFRGFRSGTVCLEAARRSASLR
jgi:hypothetical protein